MTPRRIDAFAVAAAVVAVADVVVYAAVVRAQDEHPLAWVVTVLVVGAVLASYGAVAGAPGRVPALAGAVALFGILGLLALLSIGVLVLAAAGLVLVALVRALAAAPRRV